MPGIYSAQHTNNVLVTAHGHEHRDNTAQAALSLTRQAPGLQKAKADDTTQKHCRLSRLLRLLSNHSDTCRMGKHSNSTVVL